MAIVALEAKWYCQKSLFMHRKLRPSKFPPYIISIREGFLVLHNNERGGKLNENLMRSI